MTNFDIDAVLGTDDDEDAKGPKALRRYVKSIEKERDELKALVTSITEEKKKSALTELLKSKNLPEKVAALYTGEPTEEGVNAWLSEYGDVLGVQPTAPEAGDGTQAPPGMTPGADPAVVAAQRAQAAVASGAQQSTASHAAKTQIEGSATRDDLAKALAAQGFTLT